MDRYANQPTSRLHASIAELRQKIAADPHSSQVDENWLWAIAELEQEIDRRKRIGLQVVHRELRALRAV